MSAQTNIFQVVLTKPEHFDLQKLSEILSQIQKQPRADITPKVRAQWGMIHKTDSMEEATTLQKALAQAGVETTIVDHAQMKSLPSPKRVRHIKFSPEGLLVEPDTDNQLVPWQAFVLFCAGQCEQSQVVTGSKHFDYQQASRNVVKGTMKLGIVGLGNAVAKSAGKRASLGTKRREEIQIEYYLDLMGKEPAPNLRIVGSGFDYSCLGAKKGYNISQNFRTLVCEIAGFVPDILKGRGVRAAVTEPTLQNFKYDSSKNYDQERLWLFQLV